MRCVQPQCCSAHDCDCAACCVLQHAHVFGTRTRSAVVPRLEDRPGAHKVHIPSAKGKAAWPIRTPSACGAPPRASGPIPRPLSVAEGLGHPQCAAAQWAALLISRCCACADSTIRPHACVRWRSPACARRHCNHTCRTSALRTHARARACVRTAVRCWRHALH
jgi:hypothetical protein